MEKRSIFHNGTIINGYGNAMRRRRGGESDEGWHQLNTHTTQHQVERNEK